MVRDGWYLLVAAMTVTLGCAPGQPEPGAVNERTGGVTRTAEAGEVTLTVSVDRDRAAIAEGIELTVTAEAPDGVEVKLPEVAEALSGLEVVNTSPGLPVATGDGKRQWSQRYRLEAYSGGTYQIPPLKVVYRGAVEAGEAATSQPVETGEVSSEAISIVVTSALEGESDPSAFRDIKPLAAVKLERNWAWLWWAAGAGVLGLAAGAWWWRRSAQQRREAAVVIIAPHEWAFERLRELQAEDLVGRGQIHEYYFRLSGITREYIERRFQVSAPEMTTEEFLVQVRDARYLDEAQKQAMAKFLEACDLVKFAKYQPSSSEIEHAFDAAKNFVSQTAPRPENTSESTGREAAA